MPFVDYFVGSKSADLYEAIFEVEDSRDFGLFNEEGEDERSLRSAHPSRNGDTESVSSPPYHKSISLPRRPQSQPPRSRKVSTLTPLSEQSGTAKVLHLDTSTPLSRLYSQRNSSPSPLLVPYHEASNMDSLDSSMKRIEVLLEGCRDLPIRKLKDEMIELQVSEHSTIVLIL